MGFEIMKHHLLLLFFLALPAFYTPAVGQNSTNQALWYGYTINADLSKKWFNETELMERHLVNPFEQSQFLIRTRFHKRISPRMNYGLGGSIFLFHKNGSINQPSFTQPELRPHGEFNFKTSISSMEIENRIRGELRYFQNTNMTNTDLIEGYHFAAARLRYRLQAIFSLAKISDNKSLKLKVADELMAMAGGKMNQFTFDQNRISADLSLEVSKKISFDFGYVNWFQAKPSGGFLEQHILRTVVKHQLSSTKQ